jgi:hypothetical protein
VTAEAGKLGLNGDSIENQARFVVPPPTNDAAFEVFSEEERCSQARVDAIVQMLLSRRPASCVS